MRKIIYFFMMSFLALYGRDFVFASDVAEEHSKFNDSATANNRAMGGGMPYPDPINREIGGGTSCPKCDDKKP
uniref:Uncharacterized protein n=1 Tax=Candidatus Kentrum sp. LPFa TaxID=2126335 RepID=A0A450XLV8_9GAMM|nr:MAG: hypothetical protein BECKLPF1236A_GA0070988_101051 [Candidatus Kentron sp. LPFa]VFK30254.1 MAG: hypothetical protein BECKLPF1236C_GA0070990_101061 [Candidatus Kentron sp. LPFa]